MEVTQSSLTTNPNDYIHERMMVPLLGIVLSVNASDSEQNITRTTVHKGYLHQADVFIVNDGADRHFMLPGVVIPSKGASGIDNYHEELPSPCTQLLNGNPFEGVFADVSVDQLDGDWCVVQFIGGSINQPYMSSWWPHRGNRSDPATFGEGLFLPQGLRFFKRYAGAKMTITSDGSLYIDTNESGSSIQGSATGPARKNSERGGDIQIDVKQSKKFEINFNTPLLSNPSVPSLSQPNPAPDQPTQTRADTATRAKLTKNDIDLLAQINFLLTSGTLIKLFAKSGSALLLQSGQALLAGNVGLGGTLDASGNVTTPATSPVVLGDAMTTKFNSMVQVLNDLIIAYNAHVGAHNAPVSTFNEVAPTMGATELSGTVTVR